MSASERAVVFLGVCARVAIVRVSCTQYRDGCILEEMAFGKQLRVCLAPVRACRVKNGRGRAGTKLIEPVVGRGVL